MLSFSLNSGRHDGISKQVYFLPNLWVHRRSP